MESHLAQHANDAHTRLVSSISGEHALLPAIVFKKFDDSSMHVAFVTSKLASQYYRKRAHLHAAHEARVGCDYGTFM